MLTRPASSWRSVHCRDLGNQHRADVAAELELAQLRAVTCRCARSNDPLASGPVASLTPRLCKTKSYPWARFSPLGVSRPSMAIKPSELFLPSRSSLISTRALRSSSSGNCDGLNGLEDGTCGRDRRFWPRRAKFHAPLWTSWVRLHVRLFRDDLRRLQLAAQHRPRVVGNQERTCGKQYRVGRRLLPALAAACRPRGECGGLGIVNEYLHIVQTQPFEDGKGRPANLHAPADQAGEISLGHPTNAVGVGEIAIAPDDQAQKAPAAPPCAVSATGRSWAGTGARAARGGRTGCRG